MSVTLHCNVGDIKIEGMQGKKLTGLEVFCDQTPKTAENFLALVASGSYTGCLFHRNIKGFIVQVSEFQ
jgi:peptidyl-prolyl cis-trans isomerase-like 3